MAGGSRTGLPNLPFLPPFAAYDMPFLGFDQLIASTGTRFIWMQSHSCPCTWAGPTTGSPDPACLTCQGRGWYWDTPSAPFLALVTFVHISPTPDEPGVLMNDKFGPIIKAEPHITIPFSAGTVWQSATLNDAFVEIDAVDRFDAKLQVNGVQSVPYQQNLNIPTSGAVRVYQNNMATPVSGYSVSGATVLLPSSFPPGTPYIVEFTAAKVFIAWRRGGALPHDRPFQQQTMPKRFHLMQLDLWLRNSGVM